MADPYRISEYSHLEWMADSVGSSGGKYYKLQDDIESDQDPSFIGMRWNDGIGSSNAPFNGTFDGNGKVIKGLYVRTGLFGFIGTEGVVSDLGMLDVYTSGFDSGAIAGRNGGSIRRCFATGSVSGKPNCGGLVGSNVSTPGGTATVSKCFSMCLVESSLSNGVVGGLVGYNAGKIEESYSVGQVDGESALFIGGLVAQNGGTVTGSFWDVEATGVALSAGGLGKSTAEMKQQSTFADWDFANTWRIEEGATYPLLNFYIGVPSRPVPGSPTDSEVVFDDRPLLVWSDPQTNASQYRVVVEDAGGIMLDAALGQTSYWIPSALQDGEYRWWLRSSNLYGNSPWSGPYRFTVASRPPVPVVQFLPSGPQGSGVLRPAFSWQATEGADWYHVWVNRGEEGKYATAWVQAPATTWIPGMDFRGGDYEWWIAGWNPDGYGIWSTGTQFSIEQTQPDRVTLLSPTGEVDVATGIASCQWSFVEGATWYQLWCGRDGVAVMDQWFNAADVVTGSVAITGVPLSRWGEYSWYVRGWSAGGLGAWSLAGRFMVGRPGQVYGSSFFDDEFCDDYMSWDNLQTLGAEWFNIVLDRVSGGQSTRILDEWVPHEQTQYRGNSRRYINLASRGVSTGSYEGAVRAWRREKGLGPWSNAAGFLLFSEFNIGGAMTN